MPLVGCIISIYRSVCFASKHIFIILYYHCFDLYYSSLFDHRNPSKPYSTLLIKFIILVDQQKVGELFFDIVFLISMYIFFGIKLLLFVGYTFLVGQLLTWIYLQDKICFGFWRLSHIINSRTWMIQSTTCGTHVCQDKTSEGVICTTFITAHDMYIYVCIETR